MKRNAFTLIELLVVMAIMAILGSVVFVNFKGFAQDQILNKTIGEIQTYLRLAQTNATAGVVCPNQGGGADWRLKLDTDIVLLECSTDDFLTTPSPVKTLKLENVKIDFAEGSSCLIYVTYSKLNGSAKIGSDPTSCINISDQVLVNIKNLKTNNIKSFTISKGGAIDAQ